MKIKMIIPVVYRDPEIIKLYMYHGLVIMSSHSKSVCKWHCFFHGFYGNL